MKPTSTLQAEEETVVQEAMAKPRLRRTRILMAAIVAGLVSGVASALLRRWTKDSIAPAVLGGTFAGLVTVWFERRSSAAKPGAKTIGSR